MHGFRLPGTPFELDPVKGAFDMGTLIRYLDHNDALTGAEWGHPSENTDLSPPMTIHTVLCALIKAYEIQGCFQLANAFNSVGLDHVVLVKVASTAVVSWLLGLTEPQAVDAISHAWMDGHPLRVYRHHQNTGPRKGWAGGDACMRAVHLALLTRSGQPGAPTVLSAPRWGFYDALFRGQEFSLPRPFGTWVVENVLFKVVPAEAHALCAMEAALILRRRLPESSIDLERGIHKLRIRTHAAACLIIDKPGQLNNAADRDHCMQYILAVTMLKGQQPEYQDYSDYSPWATDPTVTKLRAKMEIIEDEKFTKDYLCPQKRSMTSALSIRLPDGSWTGEICVEYPVGSPRHAETSKAVKDKIATNFSMLFESDKEKETERMMSVKGDTLVRDFVDTLWKGS
ncbi:MAG: hypothetical protein Q9212_004846 [Teloschistes hypoglaucus]